MKNVCVLSVNMFSQMTPRPGKRGRPPKQPVETQAEGQSVESGADPEASAVESEATADVSTDDAPMAVTEPETGDRKDETPAEGAANEEHTCSECGMSFQRRYSLIMHTLKHEKARGYKCSVSTRVDQLIDAVFNCYSENVLMASVSVQMCSKEFQYAASLRAHLARHKQQSSQRAAATKPSAEQSSEAKQEGSLDEKNLPPHTKREFVCDICGKTLPKLYSLRIHMLNHTGVRPHSCKVCGKTFAHKHSLKMHRALHDVTKQFQCEYCKKSFVSKRSMEEHTSLHTGGRTHCFIWCLALQTVWL